MRKYLYTEKGDNYDLNFEFTTSDSFSKGDCTKCLANTKFGCGTFDSRCKEQISCPLNEVSCYNDNYAVDDFYPSIDHNISVN